MSLRLINYEYKYTLKRGMVIRTKEFEGVLTATNDAGYIYLKTDSGRIRIHPKDITYYGFPALTKKLEDLDVEPPKRLTLKQLRFRANVGQVELAKALGVSQATISHWEKGRSVCDYNTRLKLSKELNCKVEELQEPDEVSKFQYNCRDLTLKQLQILNDIVLEWKRVKVEKKITCPNCNEKVNLISTGELCPACCCDL